jgi:hypothetical protein
MSANKTFSSRSVATRDVPAFPAMTLTPEQMQMAAMYSQMMQMQQQMQQMQLGSSQVQALPVQALPVQAAQTERIPHKQARPFRVLNAPKAVGRSGLASSRPVRIPRTAPAQNEILRPFTFACHQLYAKLVRASDGAYYNIPEGADSNMVKGIRLDDVFKCTNTEGKDCAISVADVLYGFRERGGHYTQRRCTHAAYHITNPFEAAQIYALSKGYYLANTSDPSKGLSLRIEVFKSDPKQTTPLWHGQNIQPRGVALKVDLSTQYFEDVYCFYMKPIREAARFVNSTFGHDDRSEVSDTHSEAGDAPSEAGDAPSEAGDAHSEAGDE